MEFVNGKVRLCTRRGRESFFCRRKLFKFKGEERRKTTPDPLYLQRRNIPVCNQAQLTASWTRPHRLLEDFCGQCGQIRTLNDFSISRSVRPLALRGHGGGQKCLARCWVSWWL